MAFLCALSLMGKNVTMWQNIFVYLNTFFYKSQINNYLFNKNITRLWLGIKLERYRNENCKNDNIAHHFYCLNNMFL